MKIIPRLRSFCLFAALAATAACGDDSTDEGAVAVEEGEDLGNTHADHVMSELGADDDATAVAKSLEIVLTIDEGEIMQAELARETASDPQVIAYAEQMIAEHTAHMEMCEQLAATQQIQPLENTVASSLRAEAMTGLTQIMRADNIDFEYMRLQAMMHAESYVIVGALVDVNPEGEPRAFFQTTQATIGRHRDHAVDVLEDL